MSDHVILILFVRAHTALLTAASAATMALHAAVAATTAGGASTGPRLAGGDQRGQATTEYALVLLAAALVGLMVVAWATAGGGAQRISRLFNSVIDAVIDRV